MTVVMREKGDPHDSHRLLPLVYDQLRRRAARYLSQEKPGQTLQPTALVHEAYLRLVDADEPPSWDGRGHFFAAVQKAMRDILIENARRKRCLKRGGGRQCEDLEEEALAMPGPGDDLLDLTEALARLAAEHPVQAELVKLRFINRLTVAQAARALNISTTTADRYWVYAKAWLRREMTRDDASPPSRREGGDLVRNSLG